MSKSTRSLALMVSVPALLIAGGLSYFFTSQNQVATDNAYVKQHKISISAEVGGRVVNVAVHENQHVEAGELLFRIDPEPFRLAVDEAEAALAKARSHIEELEVVYANSSVDIASAQEDIDYYENEFQRQKALLKTRVTTDAAVKAAEHSLVTAKSRLEKARADALEAKVALSSGGTKSGIHPMILSAQVQLSKARLNLAHTEVRAPASGIVSQADRLQVGQFMMQGLSAVSLVKDEKSWIEANFKETDLENMRVGQPVSIEVDSFPGVILSGRVESIGAGTGSEFSLLPAQNSNGNWVKITQRVPVRIAIEENLSRPLITGLSAYVRVDTRS